MGAAQHPHGPRPTARQGHELRISSGLAHQRLWRRLPAWAQAARRRRVAASWLVQMPWLLRNANEALQLRRSLSGAGPGRMVREFCALVQALAEHSPLVLVLEDLHWADAATVDLLVAIAQSTAPARLLMLVLVLVLVLSSLQRLALKNLDVAAVRSCSSSAFTALSWRANWPPGHWPDGSTGSACVFLHDVYRRLLYDVQPLPVRQGMHRRVAERLEQGWGLRAPEVAAALASAYAPEPPSTRPPPEPGIPLFMDLHAIAHTQLGRTLCHQRHWNAGLASCTPRSHAAAPSARPTTWCKPCTGPPTRRACRA